MSTWEEACRTRFGNAARFGEPLARHGTFAVGGPAEVWINATSRQDLLDILAIAQQGHVPVMFVGNGTNVLYADAGARGIVVGIRDENWTLTPAETEGFVLLQAGAGVPLPRLANEMAAQGLAGMEWGAGVPGTVGGAVVSNAGCHGQATSDTLIAATVLDARDPDHPIVHDLPIEALGLAYRQSRFRAGRHTRFRAGRHTRFAIDGVVNPQPRQLIDPVEVIAGATFRLRREDPVVLRERIAYFRQYRKDTQPPQPSAGSVFKNPPGDYAGRLVEAAGLKGHQIGKAAISARHANFIVNLGGATAADIVALMSLAHQQVLAQFGIALELEVELRGDW